MLHLNLELSMSTLRQTNAFVNNIIRSISHLSVKSCIGDIVAICKLGCFK